MATLDHKQFWPPEIIAKATQKLADTIDSTIVELYSRNCDTGYKKEMITNIIICGKVICIKDYITGEAGWDLEDKKVRKLKVMCFGIGFDEDSNTTVIGIMYPDKTFWPFDPPYDRFFEFFKVI